MSGELLRHASPPMVLRVRLLSSAEELLKDGNYHHYNHKIPFAAFPPVHLILDGEDKLLETIGYDIRLWLNDENTTTEKVSEFSRHHNIRLLGVRELLAFGIQHPHLQVKHMVVALGDPSGYHGYLYGHHGDHDLDERCAHIGPTGGYWPAGSRFIAFA